MKLYSKGIELGVQRRLIFILSFSLFEFQLIGFVSGFTIVVYVVHWSHFIIYLQTHPSAFPTCSGALSMLLPGVGSIKGS